MSVFLRKTGIVSSIALGIIFTTAALCMVISVLRPESDFKFLSLFSDIWLIKIFKIQAGIIVNRDSLSGINGFDILILVLFIFICLSLFEKQRYHHKTWFVIASSLLAIGIIVFIVTKLAGRSSFMAAGLIISSLFFTENLKNRLTAFTGIVANALLLTGDFTVGSDIRIMPFLFAAGYIILIFWLFNLSSRPYEIANENL